MWKEGFLATREQWIPQIFLLQKQVTGRLCAQLFLFVKVGRGLKKAAHTGLNYTDSKDGELVEPVL